MRKPILGGYKIYLNIQMPPWEWGKKVDLNGPGHITKMDTMPICIVKMFKNVLIQD